ncbi:hypothetical protein PF002_g5335 [Phytophthora fragariae]|nr:hypothetical protein PF002_g5335 [Phytophthora fragariae]
MLVAPAVSNSSVVSVAPALFIYSAVQIRVDRVLRPAVPIASAVFFTAAEPFAAVFFTIVPFAVMPFASTVSNASVVSIAYFACAMLSTTCVSLSFASTCSVCCRFGE